MHKDGFVGIVLNRSIELKRATALTGKKLSPEDVKGENCLDLFGRDTDMVAACLAAQRAGDAAEDAERQQKFSEDVETITSRHAFIDSSFDFVLVDEATRRISVHKFSNHGLKLGVEDRISLSVYLFDPTTLTQPDAGEKPVCGIWVRTGFLGGPKNDIMQKNNRYQGEITREGPNFRNAKVRIGAFEGNGILAYRVKVLD